MSLDSNCCRGRDGNFLPHYSPWPTPNSSGTNVFAQPIPSGHNIYIFPPFVLVGPLLRYFLDQRQRFAFTIIVPSLHPCRYWWAILRALAIDSLLLGRKGDPSVLQFPSSSSPVSLLDLCYGIYGLFAVSALGKLFLFLSLLIERPWKPARRCSACSYPNNNDANFCQACGASTSCEEKQGARPNVDMSSINKRFTDF